MSKKENSIRDKLIVPLIFLGIFILMVAISAEVDWFWSQGIGGGGSMKELSFVWLFAVLLPLVLVIGWLMMERFPAKVNEPSPIEGDKKKFIWSIIILVIAQNSIPAFYFLFRDELFGDLAIAVLFIMNFIAMASIAAYFPIHTDEAKRRKRWLIFFLLAIIPFYVQVGALIGITWIFPDIRIIYWILMWGIVMPLSFVFLGVSWKNGRGEPRKAFNIAMAGILIQYSFLEDFLFYALNGQPQPATYDALLYFPLDIAHLFGHQGVGITPSELLIWMIIIIVIAVVILFDVPYTLYQKISSKK
jgi:hypothetical protein